MKNRIKKKLFFINHETSKHTREYISLNVFLSLKSLQIKNVFFDKDSGDWESLSLI